MNTTNEQKPKLDLSNDDGNAFYILGKAQKAARRAGWKEEKIKEYLDKAKSGDYDNLLQVTMAYFDVE